MLRDFVESALSITARFPQGASEILNDAYGTQLKVYGIGRIVVTEPQSMVLTVRGWLKPGINIKGTYVSTHPKMLELSLPQVGPLSPLPITDSFVEKIVQELKQALTAYDLEGDGAYIWIAPDGFMAALSENEKSWARNGERYFSHETLCVHNTGDRSTHCELYVYFDLPDREILRHRFEVGSRCSLHLRLDKICDSGGKSLVPRQTPLGYKVVSFDGPVVVQSSRILTSGANSEFASFGTTMAWTP